MDYHLDHEVRLNTASKSNWALNEIDAEGKEIGLEQLPWEWTLYFTATSCVLSESFEISQPLDFKFSVTKQDGTTTEQKSGGKETRARQRSIHVKLRPGDARREEDEWRQTTYSMFGTKRVIKDFQLNIYQLDDPAKDEGCSAWGCPSYTSEGADFIDETSDDCLVFNIAVKPEAFARYVEQIDHGLVDEIILSVGHVEGFYADWSPSIATRKVKVLTRYRDHKVTLPPGHEAEPPRLGPVGDVHLYINRKLEFAQAPPNPDEPEPANTGTKRATATIQASPALDPQALKTLQSLKRAGWFIVVLLALIFIELLLRH